MKILIVEDQEKIAKLVKANLESAGFQADYELDSETAQNRIRLFHQDYDLILLDVTMPKLSGLDLCRNIRALKITTPIIMLTGRDTNFDISTGLNVGADDYLVKPVLTEMLVARINAVLRRPKQALPPLLEAQDLTLNIVSKKIHRDNQEIKLTSKEFTLLEYFIRNPNRVLNREQILSSAWDISFDAFSNVIDVHITNIRRKINDRDGKILETVRGMGYRLNT